MIDWYFVATHALWILGLSIALAAFSWHDYERRAHARSLRAQLARPSFLLALKGGGLLVAMALTLREGSAAWERPIYATLSLLLLWSTWTTLRNSRAN